MSATGGDAATVSPSERLRRAGRLVLLAPVIAATFVAVPVLWAVMTLRRAARGLPVRRPSRVR